MITHDEPTDERNSIDSEFDAFANYVAEKSQDLADRMDDPERMIATLLVGATMLSKRHLDHSDARLMDLIATVEIIGGPFRLVKIDA